MRPVASQSKIYETGPSTTARSARHEWVFTQPGMPGSVACHDGDMEAVNLDAMLARFAEHWSPKKIAQVNDYDVRIVKVQGEFTWHRHTDTDEFFLVLDGQLTIQMRDRDVVLAPRELFVVPRGVEPRPRGDTETAGPLLEPRPVVHTGDAGGEQTAAVEDLA